MICSRGCKNANGNNRHQTYRAQQARGRVRKEKLIHLKGGCCAGCGYDRNTSALEFHHENPKKKNFNLDLRSISNRSWIAVNKEAEECILLCSNCHKELHYPESNLTAK
jgi:5-methylcytosine-specific restriction endonuclease McrA